MMGVMESLTVNLFATLDRPVPQHTAFTLGQRIGGDGLLSVAVHEDRFGLTATAESADPIEALTAARDKFIEVLADVGFTVTGWEAAEAYSHDEVERRIDAASLPPLVDAKEFAELCGVRKQWIYDLEHQRAAAAERGDTHPFPTPIVPGWWIKAAAERFAATRKRKPGPAPRRENPPVEP